MRKFFIILFALAGYSVEANAQQAQSRYDEFTKNCPYRAAQARKAIALGRETRQSIESEINKYSKAEWDNMMHSCRTDEARVPTPPRAPQGTLVERPSGEPREIVKRPPNAPMGEFYRCNRDTKLPDPRSRFICGPVAPRASDESAAPKVPNSTVVIPKGPEWKA